jgi:hypothetical protein
MNMPFYFKPHTPEWFRALEATDPGKAEITKMAIEFAGNPDVCSICGDSPADDYELIDLNMAANAVATIRLCEVCFSIKTELYQESFIAFMPNENPYADESILTKYIRKFFVPERDSSSQPRQRLEKLKELRESDLITEQDYESKKAKILKDL